MWVCSTIASAPRSRPTLTAGPPASSHRGTPRSSSRPAYREEVQRPVHVGLLGGAQREVADGDRGREPVVEALGHAEAGMQPVPAELQRELVGAQLARMEQAVEL